VSIRLWWFRRKMARDPSFQAQGSERAGAARQTIEGEYQIVVEDREDRPR